MGTIPFPNVAQDAAAIAATPQNALAEYARVAQLKQQTASLAQEQQQRAQQMEIARRQMADQDALTKTLSQYDPSKHTIADIPKLVTQNGGSGQAALQAQQGIITQKSNLAKLSDEQFAQEQKKADAIQGAHDFVMAASTPEEKQTRYEQSLQHLGSLGVDVSQESPQYPGDEAFAQHLPAIRLHTAIVAEAEKERELKVKEQAAATSALSAQTTAKRLEAEMPGGPLADVGRTEMADWLRKNPGKGPSDFLSWKARQSPMGIVLGNQLGTPGMGSALDQAAERYSQSGELPAGFARSPGTITAILKRAAELHPDQNIAANKVTLAADKSALSKLTTQFEQMNAFEGTALKNLDLFIDKAKEIPDLKARFANVPLRMITGKMIGDKNQAALQAAQHIAATEVAKVLSSATGAGVLSDKQQKEVQDILDGNYPFPAMVNVVETLKQDMANRHQSYQSDINAIRGRIGAKPTSQPSGRTLSRAAIAQAAKDHGVSVEEATRQAQAAGYTIQ